MSKHIHIYLPRRTKDAEGPKHAPAGSSKGGQFVAGAGGPAGSSMKAKSEGRPTERELVKERKEVRTNIQSEGSKGGANGSNLKYDDWATAVGKKHKGATFRKDPKT
jgi:hypothetical protein